MRGFFKNADFLISSNWGVLVRSKVLEKIKK